ncbi:HAD family hydrolase [Terribacillus sp. DMT04]|uniref:HAD family hydrolase n=1 Tax=Terribacillus sp. DMT04 TaxID=2850441 RepID=UPI001C2C1D49|nr:HAD family hydrolase [Terribacillus sp. DMT04]QXE01011.1 HAD family hydrolase [Terribacillus sp. DMT04]
MKAILFDLDGTIHDRQTTLQRFLEDQYNKFQNDLAGVDLSAFKEAFVALDQHGYVEKPIVYKELLIQFALDTNLEPALTADYFDRVAQFAVAYPDALETLQELSMSYTLGIVTNGPALLQQQVIEQLGLYWHCQSLVISEAVGLKKPDPAIFEMALAEVEARASETFFVGDHIENDVIGSRNAGLQPVLFGGKQEGVPSFSNWRVLPALAANCKPSEKQREDSSSLLDKDEANT